MQVLEQDTDRAVPEFVSKIVTACVEKVGVGLESEFQTLLGDYLKGLILIKLKGEGPYKATFIPADMTVEFAHELIGSESVDGAKVGVDGAQVASARRRPSEGASSGVGRRAPAAVDGATVRAEPVRPRLGTSRHANASPSTRQAAQVASIATSPPMRTKPATMGTSLSVKSRYDPEAPPGSRGRLTSRLDTAPPYPLRYTVVG